MIGDYQTGLIQGRYILDSVAMAQEVIQDCNRRKVDGNSSNTRLLKELREGGLDCVVETQETRGFGPRWTQWIREWLWSEKSIILVNGQKGKEIHCTRGLRQGDPLSSLIFTFAKADKPESYLG